VPEASFFTFTEEAASAFMGIARAEKSMKNVIMYIASFL
jgi:hypothetical protein